MPNDSLWSAFANRPATTPILDAVKLDPEGKGVNLYAKKNVYYYHPVLSQVINEGEIVHAFRKAYFYEPYRLSDTFWIYRNGNYIAFHENIIAENFEIVL